MAKFSKMVRDWRKASGLDQVAAARELGVPTHTLQNWEQGVCEPKPVLISALTERLRRPVLKRKRADEFC